MRLQGEHSAPRTITLIPGARIRGQVRYAGSGKPAPGVFVMAKGTGGGYASGSAMTDAEGGYEIVQLRPASYHVMLLLVDELAKSWTARAREKVVVARGDLVGAVDLELISAAVVTGQVTAEDNGEPVPDFCVIVCNSENHDYGSAEQHAMSDRAGRYTLRVVPGERVFLSTAQPPPGFRMPTEPRHKATLAEGETLKVDLRLPRRPTGHTVSLRFVDTDGKAIPTGDVLVQAAPLGSAWYSLSIDPTYRLYVEVEDFAKSMRVRARHGESATAEPVATTDGGAVTVKVVPGTLGRLRGKVADPAGKPIGGVKLTLLKWVDAGGGGGQEVAIRGKDGAFDIRHLWPGATVSVQGEAVGWARASGERLEVKRGETRELPPLVLEPAVLPLAGRVVDETNAPAAELRLSLQGERSAAQETVTDRDGRFRFEGLAEEKVKLFAGSHGSLSGSGEAAAGSTEVEIVATRPPPADANPEE